jgi:hypothetical protein
MGVKIGAASSSKNCRPILAIAGLTLSLHPHSNTSPTNPRLTFVVCVRMMW